jgi:hypothetical protein
VPLSAKAISNELFSSPSARAAGWAGVGGCAIASVVRWLKARQLEGIAKAKAAGVYKGRSTSIDEARVRELKAQGMAPAPHPHASPCIAGGIEGQLSNRLLIRVEQEQESGPRKWKAPAIIALKPNSAFKWHGT